MFKYYSPGVQANDLGAQRFVLSDVQQLIKVLSPGKITISAFVAMLKINQLVSINKWSSRVFLKQSLHLFQLVMLLEML